LNFGYATARVYKFKSKCLLKQEVERRASVKTKPKNEIQPINYKSFEKTRDFINLRLKGVIVSGGYIVNQEISQENLEAQGIHIRRKELVRIRDYS
jgi:hypothetical protein